MPPVPPHVFIISAPPGFSSGLNSPLSCTVSLTKTAYFPSASPSGVLRKFSSLWHQPHQDAEKNTKVFLFAVLAAVSAVSSTCLAGGACGCAACADGLAHPPISITPTISATNVRFNVMCPPSRKRKPIIRLLSAKQHIC